MILALESQFAAACQWLLLSRGEQFTDIHRISMDRLYTYSFLATPLWPPCPLQVCRIVKGQPYRQRLNDVQASKMLRAAKQDPSQKWRGIANVS